MNEHVGKDLLISRLFNRDVYKMEKHHYQDNMLYSPASSTETSKFKCRKRHIEENLLTLEFHRETVNSYTCLALVLDYQESSKLRDVYCMPHSGICLHFVIEYVQKPMQKDFVFRINKLNTHRTKKIFIQLVIQQNI